MSSLRTLRMRIVACLLFLPLIAAAQSNSTGTITGRILNPATGEYVRDATVAIKETGQTAVSEGGGEYRLFSVPAGTATVTVTYTGYTAEPATVGVTAGGTTKQDFKIVNAAAAANNGDTVKLDKFVVSTAREGQAKMLMEQRNNMNVTNTVPSDAFGSNPEGNIAEFMRFMPGVTLDSTYGEGRNINLRGLGADYTSVMMDGFAISSIDGNNLSSRAFTVEQVSMSSLDSVEVSKTVSADMDANAPGGTINLRTKRAFDRNGRTLSVSGNVELHSTAFTTGETKGPFMTGETHKMRPGGALAYSDVFFNNRLGIVFNVSESNIYEETNQVTLAYDRTPTAADPRPQVVSSIAMLSSPRFYERFATTFTADFRATDNLTVGFNMVYNASDLWNPQRTITFTTGTRTAITGDGLTNFSTNAANSGLSESGISMIEKLGKSLVLTPTFVWKLGKLTVDGRFAFTSSRSWYDPSSRGMMALLGAMAVTGTNFNMARSSMLDADWHITQVSGKDLADPATFPQNETISTIDGRDAKQKVYTTMLNASYPTTLLGVPIVWKGGWKDVWLGQNTDNRNRLLNQLTYTGPSTNYWVTHAADFPYTQSAAGGTITTISGGQLFMPDMAGIRSDYLANPGNYSPVALTGANAYTALVANHLRSIEKIDAGYLMGTAKLTSQLSLRAGLRYEKTTDIVKVPNSYSTSEVKAAGYAVTSSTGVATTADGVVYQFLSRPWKDRTSSFDNFFPSASLKYNLPWNTDLSFGYSSTIRRAPFSSLAGSVVVNDDTQTVTITNPNLKPENSRNYALRLAHYYEPLSMIGVSVFQNKVQDKFLATTVSATDFGNTDPTLANYNFTTTINSASEITIRGLELEWIQNLGFLSKALNRFTVTGNYTRNYASQPLTGLVPYIINGGLNFSYGRFNLNFNANWVDRSYTAFRTSATGTDTWSRHRLQANGGASVKLARNLTLIVSARNVLNTGRITQQKVAANTPIMTLREDNGITTTFQLKADF